MGERPALVVVAAAMAAFSVAIVSPSRLSAQVSEPAGADHPMAQLMVDVEDARKEADAIQVFTAYCRPPFQPQKDTTQWEIDFVSLHVRQLRHRFQQIQRSFQAAGTSRMGTSYIAGFPVINGLTAAHRDYWPSANRLLSEVEGILRRKQERLNSAPERDCAPPSPPQAPSGPQPPPDPMADLKRPIPRDLAIPDVPPFFCSEAERTKFLLAFNPTYLQAAENAEDAAGYRAEVSRRGAENFIKDGDPALQRRLDAEERWADTHYSQMQRMVQRTEEIRQQIRSTPIVDCSQPQFGRAPVSRWAATVTGGVALVGNPQSGDAAPLPAGTPFTTATGRPSEMVQSWAFGSGSALLNNMLIAKGRPERVTPLNPLLGAPASEHGPGATIGATIARMLTERLSVWGDVQFSTATHGFTDQARSQVEATRASLEQAFGSAFTDTPGAVVSSTASFEGGGGALVSVGGGVEYCFMDQQFGGWHPSVRAGVGVTIPTGEDPSATLVTRYRFNVGGSTFEETDTVIISTDTYSTFGLQFGGALRRPVSDRMDIVVEVMLYAYQNSTEVEVSATPGRDNSGPTGAAAFPLTPSVQFGKGSLPSSLSQAMDGVATFKGTGMRLMSRVSAGLGFRF